MTTFSPKEQPPDGSVHQLLIR